MVRKIIPKKLILLRHAEAEMQTLSNTDITRPLNATGIEVAGRMALRLKALGYAPDLILCSSATRTRQTAAIFMEVLHSDPACLVVDKAFYNASDETLFNCLAEYASEKQASCVLLVAHNPGISYLAYRLSTYSGSELRNQFSPGSFACFDVMLKDWSDFSEEKCAFQYVELTK